MRKQLGFIGVLVSIALASAALGQVFDSAGRQGVYIGGSMPTGSNTIGGVNLAQYTPVSGRLPVDGSGVTQPVSGTVTANAGTNLNTSALALNTSVDGVEASLTQIDNNTDSGAVVGNGTAATAQRVTLASDSTGVVTIGTAVAIGTFPDNEPVNVAQMNGLAVTMGNGVAGTGVQRVTLASDSTGQVGVVPLTAGGLSLSRTVSAATTNATSIKASAGQVFYVVASNVNAAARFVHLYNTAGTPTCNASIIATFIVPGNTAGAGTNVPLHPGVAFGTGIGICITTANDGTGSVGASDVVLTVAYK